MAYNLLYKTAYRYGYTLALLRCQARIEFHVIGAKLVIWLLRLLLDNAMVIRSIEIVLIGRPPELTQGIEGEFLVTPLHTFPDYQKLLGERFVGLRGGPVY